MKNAFYIKLKALFILDIFTFLSWRFGHVEKQLDKKAEKKLDKKAEILKLKFMTSQTGQQIITIHILSNISRIKSNQTMKFGNLIEYNRILFLKNHTQNVVEKLVSDPSIKNQNWAYLYVNSLKCYKVCFFYMSKSRSTKID